MNHMPKDTCLFHFNALPWDAVDAYDWQRYWWSPLCAQAIYHVHEYATYSCIGFIALVGGKGAFGTENHYLSQF